MMVGSSVVIYLMKAKRLLATVHCRNQVAVDLGVAGPGVVDADKVEGGAYRGPAAVGVTVELNNLKTATVVNLLSTEITSRARATSTILEGRQTVVQGKVEDEGADEGADVARPRHGARGADVPVAAGLNQVRRTVVMVA